MILFLVKISKNFQMLLLNISLQLNTNEKAVPRDETDFLFCMFTNSIFILIWVNATVSLKKKLTTLFKAFFLYFGIKF